MKAVIDFFHVALALVRTGVERLEPVQRIACDLAYMHAQESDDGNVYGDVRITDFGSRKFAEDAKRWLAEVQLEVDARVTDLRDPRLPAITGSNFGSFRVG